VVLVLLSLVLAAGADDAAGYRRDIEAWQQARDTRLRSDDGWLTLVGLHWMKNGPNRFGSDPTNDIVLPAGSAPGHVGTFIVDKMTVTVEIGAGATVTLGGKPVTKAAVRSDGGGAEPDILAMGALTLQVIERHGRLAVRVKDRNAKTRREFKGLRYYPADPRYQIRARFVAHPRPVEIKIADVSGFPETEPSPGYAEFELAGKTFRLHPIIEAPGDTRLFFIFRDRTAGVTTYGAGRFLYADSPKDGHVILDFNKAYTPPCAFTPYATCPLPPEQNRLPIAIEAGERFDGHH
jgi:uncharacterized protein (DUF1684 family)